MRLGQVQRIVAMGFLAAFLLMMTLRVSAQAEGLTLIIADYIEHQNHSPNPFIWTKTADQILASIARFCERTLDSGH